MALIGETGLSSKEKAMKHSRGRNFNSIASNLGTKEGLVCIIIEVIYELCESNKSSMTFLPNIFSQEVYFYQTWYTGRCKKEN